MNASLRKKCMASEHRPDNLYERGERVVEVTRDGCHEERVTRFSDGSSIRHCGGPCGDVKYNEFGEECD